MCQGFSHFRVFLHNFVLAKLAPSSEKVKSELSVMLITIMWFMVDVHMIMWAVHCPPNNWPFHRPQ